MHNRPVGRAVTRSSLEREVWGSNLGPVKWDTVLPTACHRCGISSKGAVLPTSAMTRRWAPPTRYTLQHNTASVMKDLIKYWTYYCALFLQLGGGTFKFIVAFVISTLLRTIFSTTSAKLFSTPGRLALFTSMVTLFILANDVMMWHFPLLPYDVSRAFSILSSLKIYLWQKTRKLVIPDTKIPYRRLERFRENVIGNPFFKMCEIGPTVGS